MEAQNDLETSVISYDVDKIVNLVLSGKDIASLNIFDLYNNDIVRYKEKFTSTLGNVYPDYLNVNRPRQSEKQKEYRRTYYESVGNPTAVFLDRIAYTFSTIFTNQYYRIDYTTTNSKVDVKGYFDKTDFVEWYQDNIIKLMCDNPNGVLFVISEFDDNEENPIVLFEPCENVLLYTEDLVIIKATEKSLIKTDNIGNVAYEGNIFYVLEEGQTRIFTQTGKNSQDNTAEYSVKPYKNFNDEIPCLKIGMYLDKKSKSGDEFHLSLIDKAIPHLRDAQYHWLDKATNCAYGVNNLMWIVSNRKCSKCKGDRTLFNEATQSMAPCTACDGSGDELQTFNGGADEVVIIPQYVDSELSGNKNQVNIPANIGGYIKGDPTAANTYDVFYNTAMENAFFSVSMETILQQHNARNSERAKEIEREEKAHILTVLAGRVCDDLERLLEWITIQKWGLEYGQESYNLIPSVSIPTDFAFYSESDLLNIINSTQKSGADPLYRMRINEKLQEKVSGTESLDYMRVKFINKINPLAGKSDIQMATATLSLTWEQFVLSQQALFFVMACEDEFPQFWNTTLTDAQRTELVMAKVKIVANETISNQNKVLNIKSDNNLINLNNNN